MEYTIIFLVWYGSGLISLIAFLYYIDKELTVGGLIECLLFAFTGFLAVIICLIEFLKEIIKPLNISQKVKQIWNKRII